MSGAWDWATGAVGSVFDAASGKTDYRAQEYATNDAAYQLQTNKGNAMQEAAYQQSLQNQAMNRPSVRFDTLDRARDLQGRNMQQGYVQNLQDVAAGGGGPSVAESQLQRGLGDARYGFQENLADTQQAIGQNMADIQAQQASIAAGARGGGSNLAAAQLAGAQNAAQASSGSSEQAALAMREAQRQSARAGMDANNQAAVLRAQEIATARGQLGDAASNLRSQDAAFGQAKANLALQSQAQKDAAAQAYNASRLGVAGAQHAANMGLDQQRAANFNTVQGINAGINVGNSANRQGFVNNLFSSAGSAMGMAAGNPSSDVRAKENIQPAGKGAKFAVTPGDAAHGKGWVNFAAVPQPVVNMVPVAAGPTAPVPYPATNDPASMQQYAMAQLARKRAVDAQAAQQQAMQMTSDEDAKQGVSSMMFDTVKPYTYTYKDPERDGAGQRFGVMAQDLEKNPVGATMVDDGPDGRKYIDMKSGMSAMLAAQADMHDRIKHLEKGRR